MELFLFIFGIAGALFTGIDGANLVKHFRESNLSKCLLSTTRGLICLGSGFFFNLSGTTLILHELKMPLNSFNVFSIYLTSVLIVLSVFAISMRKNLYKIFATT